MVRPAPLHALAERFADSGFRADAFVPSYGMAEAALALSFSPAARLLRVDTLDIDALERHDRADLAVANSDRSRSFVFFGGSEERRVGKGGCSTCKSGWWP